MAFVKAFMGKYSWKDAYLSENEEERVRIEAEAEHIKVMKRCIDDARRIAKEDVADRKGDVPRGLDRILTIAVALHDKRNRHTQFSREAKAKENHDTENK